MSSIYKDGLIHPTRTLWWISTQRMTVGVLVFDETVMEAPPIVRKFIGQSINALRGWMRKQPGYREFSRELRDFENT